jgi:hypothetical protein
MIRSGPQEQISQPVTSHPVIRLKPDDHHIYTQNQVVMYMVRIIAYQNNQYLKRVLYYSNIVLLQKTKDAFAMVPDSLRNKKCFSFF